MSDLDVGRPAIEHRTSRSGRWLHDRRLRLAAWVALVEGLLVLVGAIPWWVVFVAAAGAVLLYVSAGRESRSDAVRQASWIAAASQLIVALVPIAAAVVTALAVVAVVILALVALALLFLDRR